MNLAYAICIVPVSPLRAQPSHRSEMVSQLLFGERAIITEIEEQTGWVRIVGEWDAYEGWIKKGQIQLLDYKTYLKPNQYITASHQTCLIQATGNTILPLGASLFQLRKRQFNWLPSVSFKGKKEKVNKLVPNPTLIVDTALFYLGAPYLWGGKTCMGIDCSGLVQMVYKRFNIRMHRDASQQVDQGQLVSFLNEVQAGDIAFFDNEEGNIIHVGILLSDDTIIHATETSGGVVIDKIDNGGIISVKHKKRTHQLRVIKRILTH